MHLEFLVEEPSAEAALMNLVPRIVGPNVTFKVHPHGGKSDLLRKLPRRLRGYKHWLPDDYRVIVLVDCDEQDCHELKERLEQAAKEAGLLTKTAAGEPGAFRVLNRIAIVELEAWFLGDVEAIAAAYPGFPGTLPNRGGYRNPDRVREAWEALERELRKAGHYPGGKIATARAISANMDPARNRSGSFRAFRDALMEMATTRG